MATLIEGYNFFQDLNYGDMVMVFNNPYYDFQLKEREEIESYQYNHVKELRNATMAKVNMSARETKRMEALNEKMNRVIKEKYIKLGNVDAKKNIRIDLQDAYDFYSKFVNLKPENQIESRKEEHLQKRAFANALIYFSDRYYVNDMAKIRPNKQPYSDLSSQSLKDFLLDEIFEFNLFHKIAMRKFFTKKDKDGKPVIGGKPDDNPMAYFIEHKKKPSQSLVEKALSKSQKHEAFHQVFQEESNFFFLKKPDDLPVEDQIRGTGDASDKRTFKQIAADQYNVYIELTVKLNDASLHYYRDYMAKKEKEHLKNNDTKANSKSMRAALKKKTTMAEFQSLGNAAFACKMISSRQERPTYPG